MRSPRNYVAAIGAAALLVGALPASAQVNGAGSSLAAGVYGAWASAYERETKGRVAYKATGSGDGLKQITARSVDFGGSDDPMPNQELEANKLMQIPTVIAGVVPVFNLQGVRPGQLRLTGAVLAEIFAGKISSWNDSQIQSLNSGLVLPKAPIVRVVREDRSGTTALFTEYLARVSSEWARDFGQGQSVRWTTGAVTGRGNSGVLEQVRLNGGAIGYVSYDQALQSKLPYPSMQNASGAYVAPTPASFQAAGAAAAATATDLGRAHSENVSLIAQRGAGVWPITGVTYVLFERNPKDASRAAEVVRFFGWAMLKGDQMAADLGFAPLPIEVQARVLRRLTAEVRGPDGTKITFLQGK